MPDLVLEMTDVEAGYGGGLVLQGISLQLDAGTITCIVGPNGAGKSTVLRVISGLLKASKGSVRVEGVELVGRSPADILQLGVAQVPQTRALFPDMSVQENVMLGGYVIRRDRTLLRKRIDMVGDLVPMVKDRARERAGNLSGGQRRMVEIARALILDPQDRPDGRALPGVGSEVDRDGGRGGPWHGGRRTHGPPGRAERATGDEPGDPWGRHGGRTDPPHR